MNMQESAYAKALETVANNRIRQMSVFIDPTKDNHPDKPIDSVTQAKLSVVNTVMAIPGRLPNDMPIDQSINYRYLTNTSIDYLIEKLKVPATRHFAPFAADYASIFKGGESILDGTSTGKFYAHMIHMFVNETQLVLTQQYYYGLRLDQDSFSLDSLRHLLSIDDFAQMQIFAISQVDVNDLHGRIFLEYYTLMIRAQWDKLIKWVCIAFNLKSNWDSIDEGIRLLNEQRGNLHQWGSSHMKILTQIATERLDQQGWLRPFRDNLLHKVGQHSSGVVAQKNSNESTFDLWKKAVDEHNHWREAMMTAIIVCSIAKQNSISRAPLDSIDFNIAFIPIY